MGSTIIPMTPHNASIRVEGDGVNKRYILELTDTGNPEFDLTPLLVSRDDTEDQD